MKICPNCHAAVQDDAMFCTSCGTPLEQNTAPTEPLTSNQPDFISRHLLLNRSRHSLNIRLNPCNRRHRHSIMRHLLWLRRNTNFSRLTSSIGKTIPTLQTEQDAVTIGMLFL